MYVRKVLSVVRWDSLRYFTAILNRGQTYLSICNRYEVLETAPDNSGFKCKWQWTSDLHAPKVLPFLGRWLMKKALTDHPVKCQREPKFTSKEPDVSFIIGHRGIARLPHLLATLESIAGQQGETFECLVVEQDTESSINGKLPSWVRHIHTPPPVPNMPYCRSWAFNIGVKEVRGKVIVLHDNDMLVPADYAAEIMKRVTQGYEVINLKRFIFYLDKAHSQTVFDGKATLFDKAPEIIVQNLEAGGSVAITREAFDRIGGMDESFIGWGGEDNEFWERAQTCRVWSYGYLPLVHLWHPSQPGKYQNNNPTLQHYQKLSTVAAEDRISQLCHIARGSLVSPNNYKSKGIDA